jgi:caa(3)-type oxidase subunit IV
MAEAEHGSRRDEYLVAMVILAVLTAIEVYTPELAANRDIVNPLLMVIATAKALFVVAYYMHLKYEPDAIRYLPAIPLFFVMLLLGALIFGL